jgi:pyruvate,water dikinase
MNLPNIIIPNLKELPESAWPAAGGKARMLSRLARKGYPVPPGMVIPSTAFRDGDLLPEAWTEVRTTLRAMRSGEPHAAFAVRSSGASEDSDAASFAGEFETVLDVRSDEEIRQAVRRVYASREGERAIAYSQSQRGPAETPAELAMAVIIQEMIPAELAGVLFTADPISGDARAMTGSYVHGLGDRLVSGEESGMPFKLDSPSGAYHGPTELEPYAKALYSLGRRLEQDLGGPQDIEWAISGDRLALLQARPVSTMQPYDPRTGEWNDSRRGNYLWSSTNFGEALPDVMTPLTWSMIQIYAEETFGNPLPGNNPLMGNLAGRFYINLSLFASYMGALGISRERMNRESEVIFGTLPEGLDVPLIPFARPAVLRRLGPFAARAIVRRLRNLRQLDEFTRSLPGRISALEASITTSPSPAALAQLWETEIEPLLRRAFQMFQSGTSGYENAYRPLHRQLVEEAGEEDANLLLSGVSQAGASLASLGPLIGLWQVSTGALSREAYLHLYGHRGPHELELSWPRPAEDPDWVGEGLASLGGIDVPAMLAGREDEKRAAWERYALRFPRQTGRVGRKLEEAAAAARRREAIRSEVTRLFGLIRLFALRAGEVTGLGDDVFFLWQAELISALGGGLPPEGQVQVRREAHERLSALPPYPVLIVGRFDPYAWAADPGRRSDIYDSRVETDEGGEGPMEGVITGLPGSAGVVEGVVRVLASLDEGPLLQPGEILVTATTNVGWTPLFPRAAAIVTDVGAPLSHAAIVARELGVPAVVGTGEATMRLKTGDRVRLDGARGIVEVLDA